MIQSREKSVDTSGTLGLIESGASQKQQMISEAKRPGTDNIIKSTEKAQATAELGFIDSQHKGLQQMISGAKRPGTDNIIKSREQAQATAELGFIDSQHKDHQQMISDAKRPGTDNIIKSREQAQATSQLGLIDSNAIEAQEVCHTHTPQCALRQGRPSSHRLFSGSAFRTQGRHSSTRLSGRWAAVVTPATLLRFCSLTRNEAAVFP